jgi:2,4-dienoyl-CoA reductase-like NADH-dependent reductase (Old Yellow Enzyme family)
LAGELILHKKPYLMSLACHFSRSLTRRASPLFDPIQVGPLSLPNRFMRSATCEGLVDSSGAQLPGLHSLIVALAQGEVGLVVPGFVAVSKTGVATPGQAHFYSDALAAPWGRTVAAVHRTPSKIVFQVCHAGSKVPAQYRGDSPPISPSGIPPQSRELTAAEIADIAQDFLLCAKRLNYVGADGIQFHAAHGFLLSEFLSPALNRRTDKYGQDRARLLYEIAAEVKRAVGQDFFISAKINGDDHVAGGVTPRLCGDYVRRLAGVIDLFEISCNVSPKPFAVRARIDPAVIRAAAGSQVEEEPLIQRAQKAFEGVPYSEGYNVEATRGVREIAPRAKLAAVGGIRSFAFMEKIVATGVADIVSMSRPFLRQPDLVKALKNEGKNAECVSCGLCILGLGARCHFPKAKLGRK